MMVLMTMTMAEQRVPVKHLQGPPLDFPQHRLPDPIQASMTSQSSMFPIVFTHDTSRQLWTFKTDFPVDSTQLLRVSLVAKDMEFLRQLKLTFVDASGTRVPVSDPIDGFFGWSTNRAGAALTWQIDQMLKKGTWTLSIESALPDSHRDTGRPSLAAIVENRGPYATMTQLASYKALRVGKEIGLLAQLVNEDEHKQRLVNLGLATMDGDEISTQHMSRKIRPLAPSMEVFKTYLGLSDSDNLNMQSNVVVQLPDGTEQMLPMHDDGLHMDMTANDGILGATFRAIQAGIHVAKFEMRLVSGGNVVFHRSQQHVFRVVDTEMQLDTATASLALQQSEESAEMLKIYLHLAANSDKSLVGRKFRAYAEVWAEGSKESSHEVPVAWISGMTHVERLEGTNGTQTSLVLPLEMSIKWLSRAQARLPLILRNVYVQDADSSVPLCEVDAIVIRHHRLFEQKATVPVSVMRQAIARQISTKFRFDVRKDNLSESMHFGLRPRENTSKFVREKRQLAKSNGVPNAGHRLVLVHGYCSSDTPYDTEDFTSYSIFLDTDQNRSNDEFALLLREFGTQFTSFSVVSHSQGGLASLHLYTFYWSTMDNSEHLLSGKLIANNDARLLQSVGSPYYGSSLAGGIAAIGDMIGFGCGKNTDLTHDGAELWLATIPKTTRDQMHFYTSQYKPSSWCVMVAQAVLKWPNDGTTEKGYSELEGAHFVNHVESQCHVENMKYPPQCRDEPRSKEMNAKAARS